jgi:hypothetical protein
MQSMEILLGIFAKWRIDNPSFGLGLGFVGGLIFEFGVSIISNAWTAIEFTQTVTQMTAILGVVYLGAMWNKWRLGSRWNMQHWFVRLQVLAGYSYGGAILSILTYNIFVIVILRK